MIKKPEPLIYIGGSMSLLERKVFNYLLSLIKNDSYDNDKFYYTSYADIQSIVKIGSYKNIKKILQKLNRYKADISILKDKKENIRLIKRIGNYDKYKIKIKFPTDIIDMVLQDNGVSFAYFNIDILSLFRSRFTLIIYELIIKYYNPKKALVQIPHLKIDLFRELVGLTDKFKTNYHLKHKVLEVIVKEINSKTDFNIHAELIKKNGSRNFNYVAFKFKYIKKKKVIKKIKVDSDSSSFDMGLMEAFVNDRDDKTPIGW